MLWGNGKHDTITPQSLPTKVTEMAEGAEWKESVWINEEDMKHPSNCMFAKYNNYGGIKKCYLKANFERCLLCLLAELNDTLVAIAEKTVTEID